MCPYQFLPRFLRPLILLILLFIFCPPLVMAQMTRATIFPDHARVFHAQNYQMENASKRQSVQLLLPPSADPSSLVVSPEETSSMAVMDIAWKRAESMVSLEIERLEEQLNTLESRKKSQEIAVRVTRAGIEYWENFSAGARTDPSLAQESQQIMSSALKKLYGDKVQAQDQLDQIEKNIQEVKTRIQEITGPEKQPWQVDVSLANPSSEGRIRLEYNYVLKDCGWEPRYRLTALPDQDLVLFSWSARVWQSSGKDWQGIELSLATLEPGRRLEPFPLPRWIVQPVRTSPPVARSMAESENMDMLGKAVQRSAPAAPERAATFSRWNLGQKNIMAGKKPEFPVTRQNWPADFDHLLRPSTGDQAFIRAGLNLEEAVDLPPGQASFILDNALVGQKRLRLAGKEHTLYFGLDPFVRAEVITREKKAGEKGLLNNRQTYVWDFLLRISNRHDYPVNVIVQEPVPRIRHEDIQVEFSLVPEPDSREEDIFSWEMEVQADQTEEIEMNISMQAPEDMNVDWGFRR